MAAGVGEGAAGVGEVAAGGDGVTGVGLLGPLGISGASPVNLPAPSGPLGCPRGASTAGTDRLGEEAAEEGAAGGVGRVAGGADAALPEAVLFSAADGFLGDGLSPGATMSRTRVPDEAREEGAVPKAPSSFKDHINCHACHAHVCTLARCKSNDVPHTSA